MAPIESALTTPLAPGRAEAFFELDTGGDQMTLTRMEAGLVFVVRYGGKQFRQTIASCREAGLGSALFDGTETELEVALCDDVYWLFTENGKVLVQRGDAGKSVLVPPPRTEPRDKIVTQISLPPGIPRAVKPQSGPRG